MKVTDKMIEAFTSEAMVDRAGAERGLQAALDTIEQPEVEPFAFTGYWDNPVYLHGCGTVVDVAPASMDVRDQVDCGECDCETTSPWKRIYVEKQA